MQSKSVVEKDGILMAIKIEWKAFGKTPKAGDVWLGNIFRCIGKDPTRGYLAWSPPLTKEPRFHVPEKFGEFEFVKKFKTEKKIKKLKPQKPKRTQKIKDKNYQNNKLVFPNPKTFVSFRVFV